MYGIYLFIFKHKYKIILYDGSAKNKTEKKIYCEPIENILFNNFVLIGILLKQIIHIEISTEYAFIVRLQGDD